MTGAARTLGWLIVGLVLGGCASPEARAQPAARQEKTEMSGSVSPSGESHPGVIQYEDRAEGRSWSRSAAEVPPTIAWVKVGDVWRPVTRIEISGTADRKCITKFGADGAMLETTYSAPPPPPRRAATPEPIPIPVPTPTPDRDK